MTPKSGKISFLKIADTLRDCGQTPVEEEYVEETLADTFLDAIPAMVDFENTGSSKFLSLISSYPNS